MRHSTAAFNKIGTRARATYAAYPPKIPEIYRWTAAGYAQQTADIDCWFLSPATGIELKATGTGKLAIRLAGDEESRQDLP